MGPAGPHTADAPSAAPPAFGGMPLAEALATRRSIRQFAPTPLAPPQLGQLCWAAQGITDAQGKRTAPSAGALYPIELFLVTPTGVQHYKPQTHTLEPHLADDLRPDLSRAALSQETIACAPAVFVITAAVGPRQSNTARGPSVIASWKPDTWRRTFYCRRRHSGCAACRLERSRTQESREY